jgi:hypothetical protein
VNPSLWVFSAVGLLLLSLLAWLSVSRRRTSSEVHLGSRPERDRHISFLPYIKQALANTDIEFLKARGSAALAQRVEKERRQIALNYLRALRTDFEKLVDFARVLAVMSPEVKLAQELQSFRLQLGFACRYQLIHARLALGIAPSNALGDLSDVISGLTVRMEEAISELGERAALGNKFASYNNGGVS